MRNVLWMYTPGRPGIGRIFCSFKSFFMCPWVHFTLDVRYVNTATLELIETLLRFKNSLETSGRSELMPEIESPSGAWSICLQISRFHWESWISFLDRIAGSSIKSSKTEIRAQSSPWVVCTLLFYLTQMKHQHRRNCLYFCGRCFLRKFDLPSWWPHPAECDASAVWHGKMQGFHDILSPILFQKCPQRLAMSWNLVRFLPVRYRLGNEEDSADEYNADIST